jgi:eukaryotic-like serine/threonine-protein kinase
VLAYLKGGAERTSRLVWVDRKGEQLGVLGQDANYGSVELSNNGKFAAVVVGTAIERDVLVFDLIREFPSRFTFETGTESAAIWSPDDTRIGFNSLRKGRLDLYVKLLTGGPGSEQLLLGDDTPKYPFSWSPDGQFVIYATAGQNQNLFYVSVQGDRKPIPFVQTSFSEYAAKFSPDGKWVVYRSNESGRPEVWLAPFPGPGKRTQVSTAGVGFGYPRWRRDGRELFFIDSEGQLMSATVDINGTEARVGAVVPLFDSRARANTIFPYDVSADGQRFLINMSLDDKGPAAMSITLLVNWMAALANN